MNRRRALVDEGGPLPDAVEIAAGRFADQRAQQMARAKVGSFTNDDDRHGASSYAASRGSWC